LELWHVGERVPKELYFFKEIDCGMLQLENKADDLVYFYEHQLEETLILDEVANIIIRNKKIISWTVTIKEQLVKLNLGNKEKLKEVPYNQVYFKHKLKRC
jgi:hypothetical protein